MTNIEKLYELAEVEKYWESLPYGEKIEYYPPMTAEKLIKLIELLSKKSMLAVEFNKDKYTVEIDLQFEFDFFKFSSENSDFAEALAGLVIKCWQNLSESEQAEIRSIFE